MAYRRGFGDLPPVTAATNVPAQPGVDPFANQKVFAYGALGVGLFLFFSGHKSLGVVAMGIGALQAPVFDCSTIPAGNVYAGQQSCKSLLSKIVGPL